MFFDEAEILVCSGNGGNGVVHFRRAKFVPRGGPDGGDGGRGGDVVLEVDPALNTLLAFSRQREFRAEHGRPGQGREMHGRSAPELVVRVPPGTLVREVETDALLGDLTQPGERLPVARGGRGGRGNARFANSRNQAPRIAEKGAPGEERRLRLELRLIADIGIVGVPNAGKSTLISVVTAAKPKIAPYPFTTLQPNLGVAQLDDDRTLILADIPGLIEGAHRGLGLGADFLRHVQRTRVLIHLLDGAGQDPLADFSQINSELALFDEDLGRKQQLVALSKMDLPEAQARLPQLQAEFERRGYTLMAVSSAAHLGLRELLYRAAQLLDAAPPPVPEEALPVYRSPEAGEAFSVEREAPGVFRVRGARIERAAKMTYWEHDEAVQRFQHILEAMGVRQALSAAGVQAGDTVVIGEFELEWSD